MLNLYANGLETQNSLPSDLLFLDKVFTADLDIVNWYLLKETIFLNDFDACIICSLFFFHYIYYVITY